MAVVAVIMCGAEVDVIRVSSVCWLQPAILTVKSAAEALDTARYPDFWKTVNSQAVFDSIPNWRREIRKCKSTMSPCHLVGHMS